MEVLSVEKNLLHQETWDIVPCLRAQDILLHPGLQPFPAKGPIHVPAAHPSL